MIKRSWSNSFILSLSKRFRITFHGPTRTVLSSRLLCLAASLPLSCNIFSLLLREDW